MEPFAGGAGVALSLLMGKKVDKIVINDYDMAIYSFWRAIIEDTDKFIELVEKTPVSINEWKEQKSIYVNNKSYSLELGFAAFYLNRTNRSGVLKGGPIGGIAQKGNYLIDARYNKPELINRIEKIAERKNDISVYNKEVRSFISDIVPQYQYNGFVYFDPPYYIKGQELYKNYFTPDDHKTIAESITQNVQCEWIVTYDDVPQIEALYHQYPTQKMILRYSVASTSPSGSEVIIYKKEKYCPSKQQLEQIKIKVI